MADMGPRGPQGPAGTTFDIPVAVANGGTGATTALGAANTLAVPSLVSGEAIPSGSDLNEYKTVGNYWAENSTIAASLANSPCTNTAFNLFVMYPYTSNEAISTAHRVRQVILPGNSGEFFYMRTYTTTTNTWGAWYRFAGTQV